MSTTTSPFRPEHVNGWNLLVHWPHLQRVLENHQAVVSGRPPQGPITVEINPMDACNHGCTWCFTASNRATDALDPDVLRRLIADLADSGVSSIHFAGGGEPTLFPGLISTTRGTIEREHRHLSDGDSQAPSVLTQAFEAGLTIGLITNGSRLPLLDTNELTQKLSWIRFSIDAASEARYTEIHRARGHTLRDVHTSIAELVDSRGDKPEPSIGASFIIDHNTASVRTEVLEFCRQMRDLKVDYVQLKPEMRNRGREADAFMEGLMDDLASTFAEGSSFAMLNASYDASRNSDYCWYSYLGPVIGADGSAYVCCYTYGQDAFRYGRVAQDRTFLQIWNSPQRAELASGIDPRECSSCRHSSANLLMERLYRLGSSGWATISAALTDFDKNVPASRLDLPGEIAWLREGFEQLDRLRSVGYNRILDYPTYRPTIFVGWPS